MQKGKFIKIHNDNIPFSFQAAGLFPPLCKYHNNLVSCLLVGWRRELNVRKEDIPYIVIRYPKALWIY